MGNPRVISGASVILDEAIRWNARSGAITIHGWQLLWWLFRRPLTGAEAMAAKR
jgi:hypothetical protein